MAAEFVDEFELLGGPCVEFYVVLAGYGEGSAVSGEGVVGDGGVEEMVDFWGGHLGVCYVVLAIGVVSLLLLCVVCGRMEEEFNGRNNL